MRPETTKTPIYWNYHDLILHRVHEILLVSSPYDAYILEEDGRLTEQILTEYLGMNLSYAPRATRVSTAAEAMKRLSKGRYDLVITMLRISDMDPITFGSQVKEKNPQMPVILLAYDMTELAHLPEQIPHKAIDKVFLWNGNANVFPAIIKYIEDKKNISRDIRIGDVRAIIVVEDNPFYYSIILPKIYSEILYHTRNLMDDSLNDTHRLLRMRARPKILLASTYEEAKKYYQKYHENLLGIILDIRFPKNGKLDKNAGFKLAKWIRGKDQSMPIMLQSSEKDIAKKAREVNAHYLRKNSDTLLQDLRKFMVQNFGFGDFIFRLPDGDEITRATNLLELQECLTTVPDESIVYHASQNHFSNWLAARGEFWIASRMRPLQVSDFKNVKELRHYLIDAIDIARQVQQKGRVIDFSKESFDPSTTFTRIRGGSLGGKARGLAFVNSMIAQSNLEERFPNVVIRIPKMLVIGTNEFDEFMSRNDLWDFAIETSNNEELRKGFLSGRLSTKLVHFLRIYLDKIDYPLAVRSSSLMEDSQYQSLAGLYSTYMIPNRSDDPKERLRDLCSAIKLVFASMFYQEPKSILESSIHRQEDEKMAVIIQELVGQEYDGRYYPNFSGIAQSINYYPVSYLKRNEGIAHVALGLGKMVVEGGKALRFCPKYPLILPQFYSPEAILENSQFEFYALDMNSTSDLLKSGEEGNLRQFQLSDAERDGTLHHVGSVLSGEDNIIRDSLNYKGVRVVTFANILKWKTFPLADILNELLKVGKRALGCPVELEFAVNLFKEPKKSEFYLLQIRPMAMEDFHRTIEVKTIAKEEIICKSSLSLGNGIIENIRDIVYVKPDRFDTSKTRHIATEIAKINSRIRRASKYLLIGPGRWGAADPWLGIPITWDMISGAKVIVEVGIEDFNIDPSFGSHFFQNVTSLRLGYLTINHKSRIDFVDWDWLNDQKAFSETSFVKWIHLENPITIQMDGKTGDGFAIKPLVINAELLRERQFPII